MFQVRLENTIDGRDMRF